MNVIEFKVQRQFKLFFQQVTEEGHRFLDTKPEKLLRRENEVPDENMEYKNLFSRLLPCSRKLSGASWITLELT